MVPANSTPVAPGGRWVDPALLASIESEYSDPETWKKERAAVEHALAYVGGKLDSVYAPDTCLAVAGSRIVLRILPLSGGPPLVLKVCRPFEDMAQLIIRESSVVAGLPAHPNIIKIVDRDMVPELPGVHTFGLPVTIEEYLDGPNLDSWIEKALDSARKDADLLAILTEIRDVFVQILAGVQFLHGKDVYHMDIKPENVLLGAGPGSIKLVKIVDFGYSFRLVPGKLVGSGTDTRVGYTWRYALPELRKKVISMASPNAVISLATLGFSYAKADRYATGRTIEDLIDRVLERRSRLRDEGEITEASSGRSGVSEDISYVARFLLLVAGRLKGSDASSDTEFPGITDEYPQAVVDAIEYWRQPEGFSHAAKDIEKLRIETLAQLEPEWNRSIDDQIRVGYTSAPFTPRIRRIVNHPAFSRLAAVSQLGLAVYVYPGARHSRLEHSLGTYHWALRYLESLWCQKDDPFFRCVTELDDIVAASICALLHDLGQYPHCHDVEDALPALPSHAAAAAEIYAQSFEMSPGLPTSIKAIVSESWSKDIARAVQELFVAPTIEAPGRLVLAGVISGTIDADKIDFVQRDSINLGTGYGEQLEAERLILSLRPFVSSPPPKKTAARTIRRRTSVALGVGLKGVLPAHSLVIAREHLFERVYWHRTVRAFKAMLSSALRKGVASASVIEPIVEEARSTPLHLFRWIPASAPPESNHLPPTDAAMLYQLRDAVKGDAAAAYLIDEILARRPYRPLLDLGPAEWTNKSERALLGQAVVPLRAILEVSPERFKLIEAARAGFQELLFRSSYIQVRDPHRIPSALAREVAVLIDVPRERQSQSNLFVWSRGTEPDRELDLGSLSGGTAEGWLKSMVPRIYLHQDYALVDTVPAETVIDCLKKSTEHIGMES